MAVSSETSLSPPRGEQQTSSSNFKKFFVMKLCLSTFNSISPFFIHKCIQSEIGDVASVRKLRSGDLLIEVSNAKQAFTLSRTKTLGDYSVAVSPHASLNSSRGVISESDLYSVPEPEILENLKEQGVVNVRRITIRREGKLLPTKHIILTFNRTSLPSHIKAGYLRCAVRPYIPNPLRCFKCQRFGHAKDSCRGSQTCARCAQSGHESESCSQPVKCINCKGDHPAYSRSCTKWTLEKEIQTLKITNSISFAEARRIVNSRTPTVGVSYASVVTPKKVVSVATQTDSECSSGKTISNSASTQSSSAKSSQAKSSQAKSSPAKSSPAKSSQAKSNQAGSSQRKSTPAQSTTPKASTSKSPTAKSTISKPNLPQSLPSTSTSSKSFPSQSVATKLPLPSKQKKPNNYKPVHPQKTPGVSKRHKDFKYILKNPNLLKVTEQDMLEIFTSDLSDNEDNMELVEIPPPSNQQQSLQTASSPP